MLAITKDEALALRATLAKTHEPHHLCGPDTRLVVEGYPRSGNSFAVDMIAECAGGHLHRAHIAHHTHEVANLQIAGAWGIPKVILIRPPEDAILSFHIYSKAPVGRCAKKYADFYAGALKCMNRAVVIHFRDVTGDFATVIRQINAITGFAIPEDQDFDAIRARALDLVRARASKTSEEDAMRQVAAPDPQRDAIKNELRGDVQGFLAAHPRAIRVYDRVMARSEKQAEKQAEKRDEKSAGKSI